ncbi:MAG TPA: ABC transporter permease [Flavisolibacter sp.]|nr:ABC transporter permease [Flavisolibacter sp.]
MEIVAEKQQKWDLVIESRSRLLDLRLKELWEYRDLLLLLVKRDYIAFYKQTILGPIWFFLQPLMTMIMYVIIFKKLAGLGTDNIPAPLFYMVGIVSWNYFAECLNKTSTVFKDNANVFGKVYFPRLILPFSIVMSNLVRFGVQLLLLIIIMLYYIFFRDDFHFQFNSYLVLFPVFIALMALFGLAMGMIVSAMTTKYRDLAFLVTFGVQLFMYATPVIYSLHSAPGKLKQVISLNPLSPIIEGLRLGLLGKGEFHAGSFAYSAGVIIILTVIGILIFNKTEKDFIDTV